MYVLHVAHLHGFCHFNSYLSPLILLPYMNLFHRTSILEAFARLAVLWVIWRTRYYSYMCRVSAGRLLEGRSPCDVRVWRTAPHHQLSTAQWQSVLRRRAVVEGRPRSSAHLLARHVHRPRQRSPESPLLDQRQNAAWSHVRQDRLWCRPISTGQRPGTGPYYCAQTVTW